MLPYPQNNLNNIALRYNTEIIFVETDYPYTVDENDGLESFIRFQIMRGDPATLKGQLKTMAEIAPCLP